jgi:hypothetical protein
VRVGEAYNTAALDLAGADELFQVLSYAQLAGSSPWIACDNSKAERPGWFSTR